MMRDDESMMMGVMILMAVMEMAVMEMRMRMEMRRDGATRGGVCM